MNGTLFDDAENFWRNRGIFEMYYVKNDFFSLTHNVPVAGVLRDYDTYRWGPYELLIHPSPGHTLGSVSLMGVVDGKKVAFTGDLIHSPGKVVNLYELQYQYGSADGVDCAIFSLTRIREQGPELICPSHGEPFNQADAGIADLIDKLKGWYSAYCSGFDPDRGEQTLRGYAPPGGFGPDHVSSFSIGPALVKSNKQAIW